MRVGVIGCGLIGRRRADVVRRSAGDELMIAADVDRNRAEEIASMTGCLATTDWQEVVTREGLEIVVVSTTNDWLAPITVAALQHGKHVLVEKPMARTPTEARAILQAAGCRPWTADGRQQTATMFSDQRSAVGGPRSVVKVGFNHRHHAAIWKAHELFDQGAIGDILFIRCRYGHGGRPGYEKEWRANPEISGGGELLDQGIHAIDLFRWFLGDFVEVFGFTATYVWTADHRRSTVDNGQPTAHGPRSAVGGRSESGQRSAVSGHVEDNAFALFRTATGQVASLHVSWTQWKNTFSFEVFGRDGYLIIDGLGGSYGVERLTWGRRRLESGPPDEQYFDFSGSDVSWEAEWREFMAAIREDREPLGSGYDGWQAMRMVDTVYESSRTSSIVKLTNEG